MNKSKNIFTSGAIKIKVNFQNVLEYFIRIDGKIIVSQRFNESMSGTKFHSIATYKNSHLRIEIKSKAGVNGASLSFEFLNPNQKVIFRQEAMPFVDFLSFSEIVHVINKVGQLKKSNRPLKPNSKILKLLNFEGFGKKAGLIERYEDTNYIVPIFYATDRNKTISDDKVAFGDLRGPECSFGICNVNIPKKRKMGQSSRAWWDIKFKENPDKDFILIDIVEESETMFYKLSTDYINSREKNSIMVFVHGYNVDFKGAIIGAAQLAFDTGFGGTTVLYSWPSAGVVERYPADEDNVQFSHINFLKFLENLRAQNPGSAIHLMAHSMGSRAVVRALEKFGVSKASDEFKFDQVILAAPDIDRDTLIREAIFMADTFNQFTLYASSKDKALKLSRKLHSNVRAGESNNQLIFIDGVDTIDASDVDTDLLAHSYISNTESLLMDLHLILNLGLPAKDRNLLMKKANGQIYWQFRNN